MTEDDRWIYLDGPEPERLRPFFDALRDLPPPAPDAAARAGRRLLATLDAALSRRSVSMGETPKPPARPEAGVPARPVERLPEAGEGEGRRPESDRPEGPPGSSSAHPETSLAAPSAVDSTLRSPEAPPAGVPGAGAEEPAPVDPSPAPPAVAPAVARPPVVASPPALVGTLPSQPAVPRADKTKVVPVMRSPLEATVPLGDDSIDKAIAALPLAPPRAGDTVGAGDVPPLTLEQFASLRADLQVAPARSAEILLRYHVHGEASDQALEAHWQQRFAEHREELVAYVNALVKYREWLEAVRR